MKDQGDPLRGRAAGLRPQPPAASSQSSIPIAGFRMSQPQVDWVRARRDELETLLDTDMWSGRGTLIVEYNTLGLLSQLHNIECRRVAAQRIAAKGTEARRATTGTGVVHDGPVPEGHSPKGDQGNQGDQANAR